MFDGTTVAFDLVVKIDNVVQSCRWRCCCRFVGYTGMFYCTGGDRSREPHTLCLISVAKVAMHFVNAINSMEYTVFGIV